MEVLDMLFGNRKAEEVYAMHQNFMIVVNEETKLLSITPLDAVMATIIDSFKYILSSSIASRDIVDGADHRSDAPTKNLAYDIDEVSGANLETRVP